jgi:prevent-host-death family protein
MARTVGAYEAKTHLPRLLDEVANGETITITKHGVAVARLVPPEDDKHRDVREAIEALREFRKGKTLGDVSIRELIDEGRRF